MKDTLTLTREMIAESKPPTTLLTRFLEGEKLTNHELEILVFNLYLESLSAGGIFAKLAWEFIHTGESSITDRTRNRWVKLMQNALTYHEDLREREEKKRRTCKLCGHDLTNNSHGFDQNDATLDDKGKLIHSGHCTYCQECNPYIKKLKETNAKNN